MTFLPLINRSLHAAARRRGTYWARALFATAALLVGLYVYLDDRQSAPAEFAKDLRIGLLFLSLIYCMTAAIVYTVDCLSMEKREGTLGLLFLTELKGWDIVFGKFVAASLGGFYGLLATVPILALSLLFGGVTGEEVGREALLVVTIFLFQIACGILVSALSRKQARSYLGAMAALVLFNFVLPGCAALLLYLAPSHHSLLAQMLFLPSPILSLVMSIEPSPFPELNHFWWSLGAMHGLTWLFLLLASLIIPHCWQDKPAEGWNRRWRQFLQNWTYGYPAQRKRLRAHLLALNPCYWLAARFRHKPAYVWSCLAVIAGFWAWGCLRVGAEWFHEGVYFPTALLLNSILKFWFAMEAGRQLFEDRKEGGLELLLPTPLAVQDIVRGHLLALRRQFLGPLLVILAVEFIFLAASLQRESFSANPLTPTLWLAGILLLVADLAAMTWVGLWAALTVKPPNHPPAATMLRLLIGPEAVFFGLRMAISLLLESSSMHQLGWKFYLGAWVVIGLLFDLAYGVGTWWQVRTHFRHLAVEPRASFRSQLTGRLSHLRPIMSGQRWRSSS